MKKRMIFATGNQDKLLEIRYILKDLKSDILSMAEAGADPEIVEDGRTFGENAEIKARAVWNFTGGIVLADDSGLVIDCLNGEPGVYSARYLGEETSYDIKNRDLIARVRQTGGTDRTARFVCNIAAILPDGAVLHTEETMEGIIAEEPAGTEGFGYDPIFFLPELGKTSAELTFEQKNKISHRGKALEAMKEKLKQVLKGELE